MTWTDTSPGDASFDNFGMTHGIHPLHIEDCRSDEQQAKLEHGDGYLFIVCKLISLSDDELHIADLDVFLGSDYLVTVHTTGVPFLARLKADENTEPLPAGDLFYRVLDAVVDSYLPVLDEIEDRIDLLEHSVVRQPDQDLLERIADLLATLLDIRHVLSNTRRVVMNLRRMGASIIRPELQPFLRDVLDHLERDLASATGERERLKGLLEIYRSSLAASNNEATRILTVMGTVSLPAVVIASFMGMSVKYPGWANGSDALPVVTSVMLAVTAILLFYLRKRRYL